jgi:hypothetical protein
MSTFRHKFTSFVERCILTLTYYVIFLPQAQVAFSANVGVWSSLSYLLPLDLVFDLLVFHVPHACVYLTALRFYTFHDWTSIGGCYTLTWIRNVTQLSKHIWNMKDQKIKYQIKWNQVRQARSYTNVSKKCNLCLWEKYYIIRQRKTATFNKRSELMSECRHSKKFLFDNAIIYIYIYKNRCA